MPRIMPAAAMAATILGFAVTAFADPGAGSPMSPAATPGAVTSTRLQPDQIRGTKLQGADVYDSRDRRIGSVADVILDRDGRIAQVVVALDGKNVAVDIGKLTIATDRKNAPHVAVEMTKAQLSEAPAVEPEAKPATGSSSRR